MVDRRQNLKISLTDSELEDAIEQLFPRCKPKLGDIAEVTTENRDFGISDFEVQSPSVSNYRRRKEVPHEETCLQYEPPRVSPLIRDRKFIRKMRPKSSRPRGDRRAVERHRRANRLIRLKELQHNSVNSPNERLRRPLSWDGSESVDSVEFQKFGLSPKYEGFPARPRNHMCGTVIYDDISENKFRETDSEDDSECPPYPRRFPRTFGLLKSFSSEEISSLSESGGVTSQTHSEAGTPVRVRNDKQKIIQYDKSPRRYGTRSEVNGVTIYDTSSPEYVLNGQNCETSPEFSTVRSAKPGFAKRIDSDNSGKKTADNLIAIRDFDQTEEVIQIQNKPDGSFSLFQFSTSYPQENLSPCELLEDPSLDTGDHFVDKDFEKRSVGNAYVARRLAEPVVEAEETMGSDNVEEVVNVPKLVEESNTPPKPFKERDMPVRHMYPYPDSSDIESEVEVESDSGNAVERKVHVEVSNETKNSDVVTSPSDVRKSNGQVKNSGKDEKPQLDPLINKQMQALEKTMQRTSISESYARAQSEPLQESKPTLATLRAMSQPPPEPPCLSPVVTMTALPVQNFGSMPSTYIGPPTNPRPVAKQNFLPPMANGQLRASFNPFNNQMGSGVPVFPPALPKSDPRLVGGKPDYTKQVEQFLKSQSFARELENHTLNDDGNLIGLSSTPPPPAPLIHRSTTDDGLCRLGDSGNSRCSSSSDRRTSVEAALNDIKQAIKSTKQQVGRPKSLVVNNNNSKQDAKSPVWVPRHNSSSTKRYIRETERNRRKKTKEYQEEDDCEMDKLLVDDNKDELGRKESNCYYDRTPSSANGKAKSPTEFPPSRRSKSVTPALQVPTSSPSESRGSQRTSPRMPRSKTSPEVTKAKRDEKEKMEREAERIEDRGEKEDSGGNSASKKKGKPKEVLIHEPAVLIEGVLFRARYLGSTQLVCEGQPSKATRMMQAEEAVSRIKAPDGEAQPSTEVDLFISTEKIMVLNTELKEIMMDHALRTISYIADIGDLVVLMARRRHTAVDGDDGPRINKTPRMVCHIFESEEAQFIAQSIGQAFQVAYMEFLKANGIEDQSFAREIDYQEVLNSQEIFGDELAMFSRKDLQKEVIVPKGRNEILGVVIVESGWGSMLPTVVIANLMPGGAAARCGQLNIGDQIIAINGISLVGLPLATCQSYIKNAKSATVVKMTVVPCPPVVEVKIKRPDTKYQLGFSVQNGVICSLLRGGIAERGGVRVGHRIIEINGTSVVAVPHERIVSLLATSVGEIQMKTMPTSMFRLLTGQETPVYI